MDPTTPRSDRRPDASDDPAFRSRDRILEPTYGLGEVVEVVGRHVTIAFDDGSVRKFVTSMVRITRSLAPRPAAPPADERRPRRRRTITPSMQE